MAGYAIGCNGWLGRGGGRLCPPGFAWARSRLQSKLAIRRAGTPATTDIWSQRSLGRGDLQVADTKQRTARFVREAGDLPAMGRDNLMDDGEAEADALRSHGYVGFEDVHAV